MHIPGGLVKYDFNFYWTWSKERGSGIISAGFMVKMVASGGAEGANNVYNKLRQYASKSIISAQFIAF